MPLSHVFRLCVLSGCSPVPAMTESPFAWLGCYPAQESVVRSLDRRYPILIAPTDSCARPPASGTLCFRSGRQSLQDVARPCWPEVLPGVISAHLSPDAWSPTPALLLVHLPVTSQETSAFANLGAARQHAHIPYGDFCTGVLLGAADIRSCSGLRVCSPPRSLPPHRDSGQPWLLRPSIARFVTLPCLGYASRPNRAIDGVGTHTPLDLRPCRPLPQAGDLIENLSQ